MIAVLCGGVGAARFLRGLVRVRPASEVTAIVNVGDDFVLHGLSISPDIDTITYTLAGVIDPVRGWGLEDETWNAMAMLRRYGGSSWFQLGDHDLGTHLYRTQRRQEGASLSTVTAEIARSWGLALRIVPVTDDPVATMLDTRAHGTLSFQEYFVAHRHGIPVTSVRFDGAESSRPAQGVLDALDRADRVVIAPSNPIVSIGPVLAVPGVRAALVSRREDVVAISPIVGGAALKGPADRLMRELGHDASAVGVARFYAAIASTLVLDKVDAALAPDVEATGVRALVTDTIMSDPDIAARLAEATVGAPGP